MNFYGYFTETLLKELNGDEEATEVFIRSIYEKYLNMEVNLIEPTVSAVGSALISRYKARKITDDPTYRGLDKDDMVSFNDIVCMYRIDDIDVMNSLCTVEEIEAQKSIPECGAEDMNKNMYHIILESSDGDSISGYTRQGWSIRIAAFMHVVCFCWDNSEVINLSNSPDVEYLVALWWAGFIDEPLPFCAKLWFRRESR